MNSVKKLVLMVTMSAFCMGIFVITGDAQSQDRNWRRRQETVQNSQYRNRRYRNARISPQEARRLQRQRERLYRTRNRYYRNDGYISDKERGKLQKKQYKYRRAVKRDRNDRN